MEMRKNRHLHIKYIAVKEIKNLFQGKGKMKTHFLLGRTYTTDDGVHF